MKKLFLIIGIFFLVLLSACEKKDPVFLITNDKVGKLDRTSLAKDLELIYADDSIVRDTFSTKLGSGSNKIKVYEKGGKHLLTLTPRNDSLATIENIQVMDPRFVSEEGIGLNSTFKDIKERYTIKKVVTALNNVVVFVKETNMYFTIDKEELPSNLRYATTNIEAVQIPDGAKIKYLMIGWD